MWFWQITYKIRAIETVLLDLHEIAVAVMKVSGGKLKTKTIDQWEKPDFCNSDKYFRRNYLKKFLEAKIIIEILQKSIREKKMFLLSGFSFQKNWEKLRWRRVRDSFASQIPVTKGRFEMQISCIRSSFLTQF